MVGRGNEVCVFELVFYHYIPRKNMLEDLCDQALSIRLSPSEDGDSLDHPRVPHNRDCSRFKCPRCFGQSYAQCQECHGSQSVPETHPLAFLLGQVLDRKLQMGVNGRRVCPIKEEEEEAEGGKVGAVVCPFEAAPEEEGPRTAGEESCCSVGVADLSMVQVDLSGCTPEKRCNYCSGSIENCYSACQTCEQEGGRYWLCDACSDSHNGDHPPDHLMRPVIDYDELRDKIETVSQEYQEESIENDFPEEPPIVTLDKKNSSIANYLEEDLMANSTELREPSRVKFDVEGLFSSYDFKSIQKLTKQTDRKSNQTDRKSNCSKGKAKTKIMKENIEEDRMPLSVPVPLQQSTTPSYAFADYKCDFCEMQPILNVRYHCTSCQDYDLCEKCYEDCDSIHDHQTFERVDGRLFREKAMERLFQLRDTNLRVSNRSEKESLKPRPQRMAGKVKTLNCNS